MQLADLRTLGRCGLPVSPLALGAMTFGNKNWGSADDAAGNVSIGGGRLDSSNQPYRMFTERNWKILDTLRAVSRELDVPMSQVALAWASAQPGITSLILGASKLE